MRTAHLFAAIVALVPTHAALGQFLEPDAQALYTVQRGGGFGWAVSGVRDLDADTIPDAVSSAPAVSSGRGRVTVFSGLTGTILFEYTGQTAEGIGWSIADAGDVNNDGHVDVAAGSPSRPGVASVPGGVLVFSGDPAHYGELLLTVEGPANGSGFGYALASLDDVNADGHADLLVGAPNANGAVPSQGQAFVISGADATVLHTLSGPAQSNSLFGRGVANVGDLDADGINDAVVASSALHTAYAFSGATGAMILPEMTADDGASTSFGQFFVGRCGDVSGDGTPDIYVGDFTDAKAYVYSGADGSHWLTIDAPSTDGLGPGRGMMADLNHDGHADLALGYYTSSDGATNAGKVLIHSGADGSVLRTITCVEPNYQLGFDCVGMGDVDGDGYPDLLASAGSRNRVFLIPGVNPCPADLTGDGTLNQDDLDAFVAAFLGNAPDADLDFSGSWDLDDVQTLLDGFAAGCP